VRELMGDSRAIGQLKAERYTDERFGLPTVQDILKELDKPGRDPRPEFKTASFKEGVEELKDLAVGMILEGVVTNVTNFGAFVDIGVHQDGLVHVSALADRFVKDPHSVVKAGQVVKVKVLEVDLPASASPSPCAWATSPGRRPGGGAATPATTAAADAARRQAPARTGDGRLPRQRVCEGAEEIAHDRARLRPAAQFLRPAPPG
jgi:uncharacterized protein